MSLEEAGVGGINLDYSETNSIDENGNHHKQQGSFLDLEGNTHKINDVWFEVDASDTKYELNIEIPEEILKLPNIEGFGNVYSLHEAMAIDETGILKNLVEKYLSSSDMSEKSNILNDIIYHWAGVQDIDPESRAATQIYGNVIGDARKLEALEQFLGEKYEGVWCWGEKDKNPHGQAAPYLLKAYEQLKDYVGASLISNKYNEILGNITLTWNETTEKFDIELSSFIDELKIHHTSDKLMFQSMMQELRSIFSLFGDVGKQIVNNLLNESIKHSGDFYEDLRLININSSLIGGIGDDTINGTDNAELIIGEAGNDTINAGRGDDIIIGGKGDDILNGGYGNDTYIYNLGDGFDTILDDGYSEDVDKVIFGADIKRSDVTFRREGNDLIVLINGDETQGMRIQNHGYGYSYGIEEFHFADGTEYKSDQLIQAMASFGAINSATMSLNIDELNSVDNIIASSYANKVA